MVVLAPAFGQDVPELLNHWHLEQLLPLDFLPIIGRCLPRFHRRATW